MKDRYGIDELYTLIIVICFLILIINTFIQSNILRLIEVLLLVLETFRYLSKNKKQRKKENTIYLNLKEKLKKNLNYNKKRYQERNTHMSKPLKKGHHKVKCPNCKQEFPVTCHKNEKIKVEIIK